MALTDRSGWFSHSGAAPYFLPVAEVDGAVGAYATSSPHRPKAGYRSSVETSVYLLPDATGQGLGRALYPALLPLVATAGVTRSLARNGVASDAEGARHARCGDDRCPGQRGGCGPRGEMRDRAACCEFPVGHGWGYRQTAGFAALRVNGARQEWNRCTGLRTTIPRIRVRSVPFYVKSVAGG